MEISGLMNEKLNGDQYNTNQIVIAHFVWESVIVFKTIVFFNVYINSKLNCTVRYVFRVNLKFISSTE